MSERKGNNIAAYVAVAVLSAFTLFLAAVFVWKAVNLSRPQKGTGNNVTIEVQEKEIRNEAEFPGGVDNGLVSSKEVSEGLFEGQILVTDEDVKAKAGQASWGGASTLSFEVPGGSEEDLIVLEFTAQSDSAVSIPVEVLFNGDQRVTVEANKKQNRYYVPFYIKKGGRILSLRVSGETGPDVSLSCSDFCVVDYGQLCSLSSLKTGRYLEEEFITEKTGWEKDALAANDVISDGEFLYLFRYGEMIVYREKTDADKEGALLEKELTKSLKEVGRIKNLGQVFDVRFYPERKLLLVCSRERGAYLINVKNPLRPVLYSHYETAAPCYGGDVYGDYVFLCDRYCGIEVADISDPGQPEYITNIRGRGDSEYRNCVLNAGILYAAAKEENGIDIYDVRNPGSVKLLGRIELDGQAEALEITDNRLFVATAKNSTYKGSGVSGNISFMQGSGNGLEVYELSESDPGKPVLAAREKTDGRTSRYPSDSWDISIYGDYAYVSLMNGGLYIYDIEKKEAVTRKKAFHIVAKKGTDGFVSLDPETDIMPYPLAEESHAAILHSAELNGTVYCVSDSGVYRTEAPDGGKPDMIRDESVAIQASRDEKTPPEADGYTIRVYETEGPAYDVVTLPDGNLAVACGECGIRITDSEMNEIGLLDTGHSVKDLAVYGEFVYAAESDSLAIYYYEAGKLSEVGRVTDEAYNAYLNSVEVSPDGRLALAQAGYRRYCLINCTYRSNPFFKKKPKNAEPGEMNGRNVCIGTVDGKYLGIGGTEGILWFEDLDSDDDVTYLKDKSGQTLNEWKNMASIGDECIVMNEMGYTVYNPVTGEISAEYSGREDYYNGECIADGNRLVIVKPCTGEITVLDISDFENPVLKLHLKTDYTPDLPMVKEGDIYVPLRHEGVMKIQAEEDR